MASLPSHDAPAPALNTRPMVRRKLNDKNKKKERTPARRIADMYLNFECKQECRVKKHLREVLEAFHQRYNDWEDERGTTEDIVETFRDCTQALEKHLEFKQRMEQDVEDIKEEGIKSFLEQYPVWNFEEHLSEVNIVLENVYSVYLTSDDAETDHPCAYHLKATCGDISDKAFADVETLLKHIDTSKHKVGKMSECDADFPMECYSFYVSWSK